MKSKISKIRHWLYGLYNKDSTGPILAVICLLGFIIGMFFNILFMVAFSLDSLPYCWMLPMGPCILIADKILYCLADDHD